jgi:hypothetical protein
MSKLEKIQKPIIRNIIYRKKNDYLNKNTAKSFTEEHNPNLHPKIYVDDVNHLIFIRLET